MYILAKQRDTIARTLEPTKERDSRNVSGPSQTTVPAVGTTSYQKLTILLKYRSVLDLKKFSTPTYRKKCLLMSMEQAHSRLLLPGSRTIVDVQKFLVQNITKSQMLMKFCQDVVL